MTNRENEEQRIDEIVIREAADDSSWEKPIEVSPRYWRIRPLFAEMAAKHFILSMLYRFGTTASLVSPPRSHTDITVADDRGGVRTIEVKVITGSSRWHVGPVPVRPNHFVVFVCYRAGLDGVLSAPDVYIVPSADLQRITESEHSETVDLEASIARLGAKDAWQRLTNEPAA